ncbi:MAG: hypothetical protein AAGC57_14655 [Pseudomonadota bacterium]
MNQKTVRLMVNLDLADQHYTFVRSHLRSKVLDPDTSILTLDDIYAGSLRDDIEPLEIMVFHKRQVNWNVDLIKPALRSISDMCAVIEAAQLNSRVRRVILVDCGDTLREPLSDVSVLAQYLEAISENLFDAEGFVMVADCDFEAEGCPTVTLWDTRTEDFVDHVADYVRSSLNNLNKGFGQGDVPKLGGAKQSDIEAFLKAFAIMRRRKPPGGSAPPDKSPLDS